MLQLHPIYIIRQVALVLFVQGGVGLFLKHDLQYWRCIIKRNSYCPDRDIQFFYYSSKWRRKHLDVRSSVPLRWTGWNPYKKNVIIVHGFNGTESKSPMSFIRDAYLRRGDYNVFTVDWEGIGMFPCYLSSISNTRLVAQCTAQFYSYLTRNGASAKRTVCVGHSLGAHICGMMSNHLSHKLYKIVGLDPAKPLVDRYADKGFRLTRDDAHVVQVLHTNAGFLGETPQVGHVDFCVNGGRMQPPCRKEGRRIRQARCSHFMSACYFAATVREKHVAVPCTKSCRKIPGLEQIQIPMGEFTPDSARGTYCLHMSHIKSCPFD